MQHGAGPQEPVSLAWQHQLSVSMGLENPSKALTSVSEDDGEKGLKCIKSLTVKFFVNLCSTQ